jgi:hypothetical protein
MSNPRLMPMAVLLSSVTMMRSTTGELKFGPVSGTMFTPDTRSCLTNTSEGPAEKAKSILSV